MKHFEQNLTVAFLDRVASTAAGRAFMFSQAAEAEGSDEAGFFDLLRQRVDDPSLQKLIKRHEEDEQRHAAMFEACAQRQGVYVGPVPEELKLIDRIDRKLGGFFDKPVETDEDVMRAYLLLQVIEERAATQFALMEPIVRRYDPQSADVFAEIAKDEERHLKYCRAISRRYAPSEAVRTRTLAQYRELEAEAFSENSAANMAEIIDRNLAGFGMMERIKWQGVRMLNGVAGRVDRTPYHQEALDRCSVLDNNVADVVAHSPHVA